MSFSFVKEKQMSLKFLTSLKACHVEDSGPLELMIGADVPKVMTEKKLLFLPSKKSLFPADSSTLDPFFADSESRDLASPQLVTIDRAKELLKNCPDTWPPRANSTLGSILFILQDDKNTLQDRKLVIG